MDSSNSSKDQQHSIEEQVKSESLSNVQSETAFETEVTDQISKNVEMLSCNASTDSDADTHGYSERTLAIIKPEAYEDAEAIEDHIIDNGFQILAKRIVRLTPEQAAELYKGHYGHHHFPHLVAHISSGPIVALVLAARNCISKWKTLMGPARVAEAQAYWPDSLRASYGRRTQYGDFFNGLHGSENLAEVQREIHFFFPNMIVGPILRHWQVNDYIQKNITATLTPALTALAHERPAEPILWLAEYLRRHNPNEPELAPQPAEQREDNRCHTPKPSEESIATLPDTIIK